MQSLEKPAHRKEDFQQLAQQDLSLADSSTSRRALRSLTVSLGRNRPKPQKTESDLKSLMRHRIEALLALNTSKSAAVMDYSRLAQKVDQGFALIREKTGDELDQIVDGFARNNYSLSERSALLQQTSRDCDELMLLCSTAANEAARDRSRLEAALAHIRKDELRLTSEKSEVDQRISQLKKVNAELDLSKAQLDERLKCFFQSSHRMIATLANRSHNRDGSFGGPRERSNSMVGSLG